MTELTPRGFECMVSIAYSASSDHKRHLLHSAVFRSTVFGLEWLAVCDPSDNQQEWTGRPLRPVCFQRSCMSRGVVRRKCAEREGCSSTVSRGEAGDDPLHGKEG